jgi:membrane protease YdiL (CAAX protease family)
VTGSWVPPPGPYAVAPTAYAAPPGPVPPRPAAPPGWTDRPHDRPQPYLHLLRTRRHRWWKSLLGLLLVAVLWGVTQVVTAIVMFGYVLATGGTTADGERFLTDVGPGSLLLTNIVLAAAIPITGVAVLACHQERMGWLSSVLGRFRWRLLFGCVGSAVALMAVSVVVGAALPSSAGGGLPTFDPPPVRELVALTAVFALTTPLQAAGEEFLFRGYVAQAIGSWIPSRLAALLVTAPITATLFAFAHGLQDPWLFADRWGFGLAASLLVWLTGGLEAAIALHAVNNLVAFAFGTLTGTLAESVTSTEAPAGAVVLDLVIIAAFTAGVWLWTFRRPVRRLSDAPGGGPFWSPR